MPEPVGPIAGLGAAASKEAIKPVASITDALAGPWIARLRRWAADRDLANRLEDPALPHAFAGYSRRLTDRISVLSTVIAREPLPFITVYEPLALSTANSRTVVPDAELRREGARTFVVDGAGMGKSTFARHLITQALEADDLVPVLLELRRIEGEITLSEAIARQFDDFDRPFDRDLLFRLFAVGRFFFVLDGLDEVPVERRATLLTQIEELAVGAERSALVLTSRPETPLPSVPGARLNTIRPLTAGQAESLVRRYDKALGDLDIGERLIGEFSAVPDRFLNTPLLVALLYRTFGYTHSVSTRISIFYDELYNALYKGHDLTKSGFVRPKDSGLDVSEFRRLLRGFAFLLITNQKSSLTGDADAQRFAADAARLTSVTPVSPAAFVNDLLSAVPLLVRDGNELRFVHKSVAEFFAAEYLTSVNPIGEQLISDIVKGPSPRRFLAVFDFVADLDPPLFRRSIVAPIAEEALAFEPGESNPVLRALCFLSDVYIAFWPEKDPAKEIPDPPNGGHYFYMYLHPNITVTVASRPYREPMTGLIWEALSMDYPDEVDEVNEERTYGIPTGIPQKIWLRLKDERVVAATADRRFQAVLREILGIVQPGDRNVDEARVLDDVQLNRLIGSAREEHETLNWLRKLFAPNK